MSFNSIELTGDVKSSQQVEVTDGKFKEITLECGDETVTIKGKIKQIMRSTGVSSVVAVEVNEPGKATYQVNTLNSEVLRNADGSDRVETPGTQYKPVPGGKAYQALDPHEGGDEDVPTEDPSSAPSTEETTSASTTETD